MTSTTPYDFTLPVRTDAEIRRRVADLIGPACDRALWPLFLDRDHVQLPLVLPIRELPDAPGAEETERIVALLAKLTADADIGGLVLVLERPGSRALSEQDRILARRLAAATRRRALPVRAMLLVHDDGIRTLDPDAAN